MMNASIKFTGGIIMTESCSKNKQTSRERFWQRHIRKWESKSGALSQVAYCKCNNLNVKSFRYWKHKLAKKEPKPALVKIPLFPKVETGDSAVCKPPFKGYRLEIENEFNPSALCKIVEILRGL